LKFLTQTLNSELLAKALVCKKDSIIKK